MSSPLTSTSRDKKAIGEVGSRPNIRPVVLATPHPTELLIKTYRPAGRASSDLTGGGGDPRPERRTSPRSAAICVGSPANRTNRIVPWCENGQGAASDLNASDDPRSDRGRFASLRRGHYVPRGTLFMRDVPRETCRLRKSPLPSLPRRGRGNRTECSTWNIQREGQSPFSNGRKRGQSLGGACNVPRGTLDPSH
jgi:hypothetical protein